MFLELEGMLVKLVVPVYKLEKLLLLEDTELDLLLLVHL